MGLWLTNLVSLNVYNLVMSGQALWICCKIAAISVLLWCLNSTAAMAEPIASKNMAKSISKICYRLTKPSQCLPLKLMNDFFSDVRPQFSLLPFLPAVGALYTTSNRLELSPLTIQPGLTWPTNKWERQSSSSHWKGLLLRKKVPSPPPKRWREAVFLQHMARNDRKRRGETV